MVGSSVSSTVWRTYVPKFQVRDDSSMFNSSFNSNWYPCNGIRLTGCCYANASHFSIHRPLNQTRTIIIKWIIWNNMHTFGMVRSYDYHYVYLKGLWEFETSISKQEIISAVCCVHRSLCSAAAHLVRAQKKEKHIAMRSRVATAAVIALQFNLTRTKWTDSARFFPHNHTTINCNRTKFESGRSILKRLMCDRTHVLP